MGCDIHTMLEVRLPDGTWECLTPFETEEDDGETYSYPVWDKQPYRGRNYQLFTILAGVRDYSSGVEPISEPRGVPEDASQVYKDHVNQWDSDGHSHSYFTLQELFGVDWTRTFKQRGVVSASDYSRYKKWGYNPLSWCQWTSEKTVSNEEMDEIFERSVGVPDGVFTAIEWEEPFYEAAKDFLAKTVFGVMIKEWQERGALASPNDIRLVFFFDN